MKQKFFKRLIGPIVLPVLAFLLSLNFAFGFDALNDKKKEKKKSRSALGSVVQRKMSFSKEAILGQLLKNILESQHFSKKKINDKLSNSAYKKFLEKMDYGKQFLIQADVKKLDSFSDRFDDDMVSGNIIVLKESYNILSSRIATVKKYVEGLLKKPFNLKLKETFQTDSEKRKYAKDIPALKERWRRILKLDLLSRYSDAIDEQNGVESDSEKKKRLKKKLKKKVVKKKSPKQLEKYAREKVAKSYKRIFKRISEERASDKHDKFFNSIAKIYDPHTSYLPPEEKEDFDIDMSGQLEGIGALLREENQHIKVERIIPGSASWKGKDLKAEDVILKVGQATKEPQNIVDMPLRDAVKLIRGKKGTEVRLTVKRPSGEVKVISIVRDVVTIEEGFAKATLLQLKKKKSKIGYIHLPKFYRDFQKRDGRNCTEDIREALKLLKTKSVSAVILDLRNNGGGALEDARMISGLFIDKGPIVQVQSSNGEIDILKDDDSSIEFDKPVVVLLNRFSASASEIVAAALQDYKRALIVGGEQSHGKGTVQALYDLNRFISPAARSLANFGAIKLTIQQFFRINGSSTQYKGVTPDIILPDQYSYMESGEKYLDFSLPWKKINEVPHKTWKKFSYDIKKLKANSAKRVSENKSFKRVTDSVTWLKARKDNSIRNLALKDYMSYRKKLKDKADTFKNEDESKNILITDVNKSATEDKKERFKEFKEGLLKDPYIEESLYIVEDILNAI